MNPSRLTGCVCGIVLVLASSTALAQEPLRLARFELERLDLNPDAAGSLTLGTGELLPAGDFRFSAVAHYQHDPLVLSRQNEVLPIVGSRATLHLAAAYAPFTWLELGVQLPAVVFQTGKDLSSEGISRPASFGLATPLLSARVGLISQQRGAWGDLALEMGVGAPIGTAPGFARDDGFRYSPRLMVGRRFGWFRLALDTRVIVRPAIASYSDSALAWDAIGNEAQVGLAAATVGRRMRWELALRGSIPLAKQASSLEFLLGPRYLVNPSLEMFALAGIGGGTAPGTPLFRVMIGTAFGKVIPPRLPDESAVNCSPELEHLAEECPDLDDDGDGVPNGVDQCVSEAGTIERHGCQRKDSDNDGIEDELDACPDKVGIAALQGCPVPDQDGDGVKDEEDACPSVPGVAQARGCPLKDRDNDGIEDDDDQCPDLAGIAELKGCPESDPDRDSIVNAEDVCAKDFGPTSNHGCPPQEVPLVVLSRDSIMLVEREKIVFAPGQARIMERSFEALNWVARVIREHPGMPTVVVGAHTDDRGNPEENRQLSQARAEEVRKYLIQHGVAPDRLVAKGYGGDVPKESNDTFIGRENNRRVEFIFVAPQ